MNNFFKSARGEKKSAMKGYLFIYEPYFKTHLTIQKEILLRFHRLREK